MSPPTGPIVIVGGGPAGLAAAYRLSAQSDASVLLLERAPRLGGLAAGMERDEMRLDFGPHRLHTQVDPEVMQDLRQLLGDELRLHNRRGLIRLRGRYLPFPPTMRTVLGLGAGTLLRAGVGMAQARLARRPAETYAEAVSQRVGRPLYELFYGPFARKVWGREGEQLAAEQAERRVNQRGPLDFLRMLSSGNPSRRFYYPRGGFGRIPEAYVEALRARPNVRLLCEAQVCGLQSNVGRLTTVEYEHRGLGHRQALDHLVWTAPLPTLAELLAEAPAEARSAAEGLRYRAVIIAFAQVGRAPIGPADTYYFPESIYPFNRVMDQRRFSPATVPGPRSVLVMDVACDPDDARFSASDAQLEAELGPALEAAGLVRAAEIEAFWTARFRSAYPIYDLGSARALASVHAWLDQIPNLWLTGRQALFLHNNTHHSLLMGYRAADAILDGGTREKWLEQVASFADFTVAD